MLNKFQDPNETKNEKYKEFMNIEVSILVLLKCSSKANFYD